MKKEDCFFGVKEYVISSDMEKKIIKKNQNKSKVLMSNLLWTYLVQEGKNILIVWQLTEMEIYILGEQVIKVN